MTYLKTLDIYNVNYSCVVTPANNDYIYVAISYDTLLLYDEIMYTFDTLIQGDSRSGMIIGADAEDIAKIIHQCYDIRESNRSGIIKTNFGFTLTFY